MWKRSLLAVLAGCLVASQTVYAFESLQLKIIRLPDVRVLGKIDKNVRQYQVKDGKRFVTNPYGSAKAILFIAKQTKQLGSVSKVSTRKFKMPSNYVGSSITQYKYTFSNGHTFSLFEGQSFEALGYYAKDGHLVFDVLNGGGAFSAPRLWGPYDQLIGKNYRSHMELLMGDGKQDGMGTMKASYSIGYSPVLAEEDFNRYGQLYNAAVSSTLNSLLEKNDTQDNYIVSEPVLNNSNI